MRVWDVSTQREVAELNGHTNWVTSVAFDVSGKYLASGGARGVTCVCGGCGGGGEGVVIILIDNFDVVLPFRSVFLHDLIAHFPLIQCPPVYSLK